MIYCQSGFLINIERGMICMGSPYVIGFSPVLIGQVTQQQVVVDRSDNAGLQRVGV